MVKTDGYMIKATRLAAGETCWDGPLAFIDLDTADDTEFELDLPPCPVIGLGDPQHPLAARLDAVIEAPVTVDALVRQIVAHPRAAAVTVELLRMLPNLSLAQGLVAESLAYAVLQGSAEHAAWLQTRKVLAMPPRREGRVRLERRENALTITMDHPESGNAIDRAMRDQLAEAFVLAALDCEIHTINLRGAGRTFSMGAELDEFGTTTDPVTAHAIRGLTLPAHNAARCGERMAAHVQGGCVGAGLELAGFARRIVAAPDAWFQLPELAMGILPGAGGCVSLTRRIGRQRTALMILSGRRISAGRALDWGLIDEITADDSGANIS